MSDIETFDIAIIGASLAGSTLALRTLRAGYRVCLVDRESFPRSKSCGEGLSGAGVSELRELGVIEQLLSLQQADYNGYEIQNRSGVFSFPSIPISTAGLEANRESSIGISRASLDTMLVEEIRKFPNLVLLERQTIKSVTTENPARENMARENMTREDPAQESPTNENTTQFNLASRNVGNGSATKEETANPGHFFTIRLSDRTIAAKFLIAADGANSRTREVLLAAQTDNRAGAICGRTGAQPRARTSRNEVRTNEKTRFAFTMWFKSETQSNRILIVVRDRYEIFFTPIGRGEYNCSVLTDDPEILARDRSYLLNDLRALASERFKTELVFPTNIRGVAISPGYNSFNSDKKLRFIPNFLSIGDAAEVFDPIGGMGMTHALRSSRIASEHLLRALRHDGDQLFEDYQLERDQMAREFRGLTRTIRFALRDLPSSLSRPTLSGTQLLLKLPFAVQGKAVRLLSEIVGR